MKRSAHPTTSLDLSVLTVAIFMSIFDSLICFALKHRVQWIALEWVSRAVLCRQKYTVTAKNRKNLVFYSSNDVIHRIILLFLLQRIYMKSFNDDEYDKSVRLQNQLPCRVRLNTMKRVLQFQKLALMPTTRSKRTAKNCAKCQRLEKKWADEMHLDASTKKMRVVYLPRKSIEKAREAPSLHALLYNHVWLGFP